MKKPDIVFGYPPHMNAVVFAKPDEARRVHQIHFALKNAKTWKELAELLPEGEYENLAEDMWYDADEERPAPDDKFDAEYVPGYYDGDYPAWLQKKIDSVLPADILSKYARSEITPINGCYWHIDSEHKDKIVEALRERGYVVEDWSELLFY